MIKISFKKKAKKKSNIVEYSKKAITALIILWFVGAVFGMAVVIVQLCRADMVSLSDVLLYIGAPMTGGIVAYLIKSAQENKEKIKKGNAETNSENDLP